MILTITQPSYYHYEYTTTMQLETALVSCFCNTELRTATVTKIKGLSIQTQQNMFVLFTLLKLTLDKRKTLTKISTCNLSQQFPQTSARFGHDKIRNKKTSKLQRNRKVHRAQSGGRKRVKSILQGKTHFESGASDPLLGGILVIIMIRIYDYSL